MKQIAWFILGLVALVAAQSNGGTGTGGATCSGTTVVAATLNANMLPTAVFRQERLQSQINFFQSTPIDVLCVNSLYDQSLRNQFISGLASQYPHSFYPSGFPLASGQCTVACSTAELTQLNVCIETSNCSNVNNPPNNAFATALAQMACARQVCGSTLQNLSPGCVSCLGLPNTIGMANWTASCEAGLGGCSAAFNGFTGNVILSKYPLTNTDVLRFTNSPLAENTVLYAQVQVPGANTTTNVFCSQFLPPNFSPYNATSTQFETVNLALTNQLLSFVDSKTGSSPNSAVLIMGDTSSGPEVVQVLDPSWQNNYNRFSQSGYQDALVAVNPTAPVCTYCRMNILVVGNLNMLLDHIFIRNAQLMNATRFGVDKTTQVVTPGGVAGVVPLSDHYGVLAQLCFGQVSTGAATGAATGKATGAVTGAAVTGKATGAQVPLVPIFAFTVPNTNAAGMAAVNSVLIFALSALAFWLF